jgi:hypothetical protein
MASERQREVDIYQKALEKSAKLKELKQNQSWDIIDEIINSLVTDLSNDLVNGSALDHEAYLIKRSQLDGVRAVSARMNKILNEGKQAADSLKQING